MSASYALNAAPTNLELSSTEDFLPFDSVLPRLFRAGRPLFLWRTGAPKGPGLAQSAEIRDQFPSVLFPPGKPVRIETSGEESSRDRLERVVDRNNSVFRARLEIGPISHMLFRPEDVHAASSEGQITEPIPVRDGNVIDQPLGFALEEFTVTD